MTNQPAVGFAPHEIRIDEPTRAATLKWVIAIDETLPPGLAVNAAVCVSAPTAVGVAGLLGPAGLDADGSPHPGLPWLGCSILAASSQQLTDIRARAAGIEGVFVADMPGAAQRTRVYAEYLDQLGTATSDQMSYYAVSVVGLRNRIDKLVKTLSLLP